MREVETSKVNVSGVREDDIATQLEFFCANSAIALTLMNLCGQNQLVLTVQSTGGECVCSSRSAVALFWDDCNNDLKNISESALFEMKNSLNYDASQEIVKKLGWNRSSLLEFGYDFAAHEAPSTTLVHDVLIEMGSSAYRPSTWGLKQQMSVAAATNTNIPIERIFANAKHDANAMAGWQSLKSKYLYAYEKFEEGKVGKNLLSSKSKLNKIATVIKTPGPQSKQVVTHKTAFMDLIKAWNQKYNCTDMSNLRGFYAAYIFALKALQRSGWKITWNQGSKGNWLELANEILRVDLAPPNAWKQEIEADLKRVYL